jgi:hypothetical protein
MSNKRNMELYTTINSEKEFKINSSKCLKINKCILKEKQNMFIRTDTYTVDMATLQLAT